MGRNHDRRRITSPPISRIGSAPNFERDDMIRQAFKAQETLKTIKEIMSMDALLHQKYNAIWQLLRDEQ